MSEELFFVKSSGPIYRGSKHEKYILDLFKHFSAQTGNDINLKSLETKLKKGKKPYTKEEVEFIFDWAISEEENPVFNLFEAEFINLINSNLQQFGLELFWSIIEKSKVRTFWDLIHEYENIFDVFYNEIYTKEEFESLLNFVLSYSGMISRFLYNQYYEKEAYEELAAKNTEMLEILEMEDFEIFNKAKKYFDHQSFEFLKDLRGIKELVRYRNEHAGESPLIIPAHLQRSETRESLLVQLSDLVWIADRLKSLNSAMQGSVYLIHHY